MFGQRAKIPGNIAVMFLLPLFGVFLRLLGLLLLLLLQPFGMGGNDLLVGWKARIWFVHVRYPGGFAFWPVHSGSGAGFETGARFGALGGGRGAGGGI